VTARLNNLESGQCHAAEEDDVMMSEASDYVSAGESNERADMPDGAGSDE
jgi:hypothetical protein